MKASSNVQRVAGSDQVAGLPVAGSPGILSHMPGLPAFGLMMAGYHAMASTSSRGMLAGSTGSQVGGAATFIPRPRRGGERDDGRGARGSWRRDSARMGGARWQGPCYDASKSA